MAEATHPRADIRAYVAARLAEIEEIETVSTSRVHNFRPGDLPAAAVYATPETATADNLARALTRTLSLAVDLHFKADDDETALDDEADALCLLVEAALAADPRWNRSVQRQHLARTEIGFNGEGTHRVGLARLTYTATYRTTAAGAAV